MANVMTKRSYDDTIRWPKAIGWIVAGALSLALWYGAIRLWQSF